MIKRTSINIYHNVIFFYLRSYRDHYVRYFRRPNFVLFVIPNWIHSVCFRSLFYIIKCLLLVIKNKPHYTFASNKHQYTAEILSKLSIRDIQIVLYLRLIMQTNNLYVPPFFFLISYVIYEKQLSMLPTACLS